MPRKSISAFELCIHLKSGDERELFKWLVASFLFGKRIQQSVAAQAYRVLIENYQLDTPAKMSQRSHRELVRMLGEGRYVRYDESTADRLLKLCRKLNDEYGGKVSELASNGASLADVEKRLLEFEGIGPVTARIFLREAGPMLGSG